MGYKKYWAAMAAAGMIGAMSLGSVFTSYEADGWSKSNDSWTYIYNGQTHTGWLQTSEGWYYMDLYTGYMTTGFKQIDGKWYFFRPNGLMAMGWINPEYGKWYYLLNDGSMVTGWLKIGNATISCGATEPWQPAGVRWTGPGIISRAMESAWLIPGHRSRTTGTSLARTAR